MNRTCLTFDQVAELLVVTSATVWQWAEKGELLNHETPAGHRRFRADNVEHFASSRGLQLNSQQKDDQRLLIVDDDIQLST